MYNHPYEPYAIQTQFMNTLYELLKSDKKLGIFESPTGTGKTLSLLCPSITWLRNLDKIKLDQELEALNHLKGPPFVKVAAKKTLLKNFHEQGEALKTLADRSRGRVVKRQEKRKKLGHFKPLDSAAIDEFLLDDPIVDAQTDRLLEDVLEEPDPILDKLVCSNKIFFASRTHSQLSQFVSALKPFKLEATWSNSVEPIKHVPLGSRKQLCTNPEVRSLPSTQQINDKCSDLRKKNACRYFEHNKQQLTEEIVTQVLDIEDLAQAGRELKSCSYYAAREALPYAEIVTLPYQLLVDESTRKTLKINLCGSLVIVDEAHNIMDVITSMDSLAISQNDVQGALQGLYTYKQRVGQRLSTRNKTKLDQTILVVESLNMFLQNSLKLPAKDTAPGKPIRPADLFAVKNIDMIDLWELKDWFAQSKLVFKLDGYIRSTISEQKSMVLGKVVDFLTFSSDPSHQGKLFYDKVENQLCMSFLSLDPSPIFAQIVNQAAKVVLAGGTMEPIADYIENLVPYLDPAHMEVFSCGHIIPDSQLLVRVVNDFEFTFASRDDKSTIGRLGKVILDLVAVVPDGLVVFFQSYKYFEQVVTLWKSCGIYRKLNHKKRIFTEDKTTSVDKILDGYAKQISSGNGALMFAVVGGKLSEGINFSDGLARGVIMVGLPFPNAFSAEMIAKREFIEAKCTSKGMSKAEAVEAAREQYENVSMRAVNQSVGRAIRHIKDYSAIYLIDKRYEQPRIKDKLSGWIRAAIKNSPSYVSDTNDFFRNINIDV